MKSSHSYFKLIGGKLKTKYHSHTRVRLRFSLSLCFFGRGRGGVEGFWAGWGLASSPQAIVLNLHFENFNPYQFCSL